MNIDQIGQLLKDREIIYNFLGLIFYRGPEDSILNPVMEINLLQQLGKNIEDDLVVEGSLKMHTELVNKKKDSFYKEELWDDYNRLFIGPGPLKAPPWESVYLSKERLVFGDETLRVREFYERFGLTVKEKNKVPDDHVGLELEFIAFLSGEALKKCQENEDISLFIDASQKFLKEHLKKWVPDFCKDIENNAQTNFFKGLGKLTRSWLQFDEIQLKNILKIL